MSSLSTKGRQVSETFGPCQGPKSREADGPCQGQKAETLRFYVRCGILEFENHLHFDGTPQSGLIWAGQLRGKKCPLWATIKILSFPMCIRMIITTTSICSWQTAWESQVGGEHDAPEMERGCRKDNTDTGMIRKLGKCVDGIVCMFHTECSFAVL